MHEILRSHQKVQRLLFEQHTKAFPYKPVPLLYQPQDTQQQNCLVVIPGPVMLDGRCNQEELVLNDVVEVEVEYAQEVMDGKWGADWALG